MKKYIIIILVLLGFTSTVKAENTDLSAYDNVIYVASTSLEVGSNATLSICMKNAAPIRGFQFNLYLPEGITAVKNSKGRIQASLSADRLDEGDEHTLSVSEHDDGSLLFLCGSQYDETFLDSDGEIGTLSISVADDMAPGEYPILVKTMKLTETDISKFYEIEQVETHITIVATASNRVILDETATTVPTAALNVDVLVKRTINATEWSTIVLPFDMTETQVNEAFGNDVQLGDFTGYETIEENGDITDIKVNFNAVTAIAANHPYIIKVNSDVSEFYVDGVDVVPEEEPCVALGTTTGRGPSAVYHPMDFIGTYVADFNFFADARSKKPLFLSGNNFYYATANTMHMKAFRAYFDFDDVLPDVEEGAAARIAINLNNSTTTEIVSAEKLSAEEKYYDLQGRAVVKPGRGIYVKERKKVVVK